MAGALIGAIVAKLLPELLLVILLIVLLSLIAYKTLEKARQLYNKETVALAKQAAPKPTPTPSQQAPVLPVAVPVLPVVAPSLPDKEMVAEEDSNSSDNDSHVQIPLESGGVGFPIDKFDLMKDRIILNGIWYVPHEASGALLPVRTEASEQDFLPSFVKWADEFYLAKKLAEAEAQLAALRLQSSRLGSSSVASSSPAKQVISPPTVASVTQKKKPTSVKAPASASSLAASAVKPTRKCGNRECFAQIPEPYWYCPKHNTSGFRK